MNKLLVAIIFIMGFVSCGRNKTADDIRKETERILQDSVKINDELFKKDSLNSLNIKGYEVKAISDTVTSYYTTVQVEYISLVEIVKDDYFRAAKNMWTSEKLNGLLEAHKSLCKGGKIKVNIVAKCHSEADISNYSIVIKNMQEKELYRHIFEESPPVAGYRTNEYYNLGYFNIPEKINFPVYIYIIDELSEGGPMKFKISKLFLR